MKQVIESLKRQIRVEEAAIFANNRDQISRKIFPGYRGSPPHPERSEYLEELKKVVKILESPSADQAGEDNREAIISIISGTLYNAVGNTDKSTEIAEFILKDLEDDYNLTPKIK
jgi:hypothetical protein